MRFLKNVEDSWVEMGEEEVRGKIAHSLRDCKVRSTMSDESAAYMKALIHYNSVVKRCISECRPLPLDEVSKACVAARTDGMQVDLMRNADSISSDDVDPLSPLNSNPENPMSISAETCSELLLVEEIAPCDDLADEMLDEFVTSTDENGEYTLTPKNNTSPFPRAA